MISYFYYHLMIVYQDIIFNYIIMNCKISVYLAYAMAIYTLASIFYMIRTRTVGTPFRNSLTKKQLLIKKESARVRRNIFYQGIALSTIAMLILRPFNKC